MENREDTFVGKCSSSMLFFKETIIGDIKREYSKIEPRQPQKHKVQLLLIIN